MKLNVHTTPIFLPTKLYSFFTKVAKFKIMLDKYINEIPKAEHIDLDIMKLEKNIYLYVVACHIRTVPSSEPVIIIGSSGWKQTADTLCV